MNINIIILKIRTRFAHSFPRTPPPRFLATPLPKMLEYHFQVQPQPEISALLYFHCIMIIIAPADSHAV